ncbi:hypothetical protein F5146DRAFT_937545, partial [Armillaria mellea]
TTLLNVLVERADIDVVTGDQFINRHDLLRDFQSQTYVQLLVGLHPTPINWRHTEYSQQKDTHVRLATIREALFFSEQLHQPMSVPLILSVEKCNHLCGLEPFRGATVSSLSIEYRKRTTIGQFYVFATAKATALIDELTSGLDSQSAWAIMLFLRDFVDNVQAILCRWVLGVFLEVDFFG